MYSLDVVVNVGWCATTGSDDWLHDGDYHTDTFHQVVVPVNATVITRNVQLACTGGELDQVILNK